MYGIFAKIVCFLLEYNKKCHLSSYELVCGKENALKGPRSEDKPINIGNDYRNLYAETGINIEIFHEATFLAVVNATQNANRKAFFVPEKHPPRSWPTRLISLPRR